MGQIANQMLYDLIKKAVEKGKNRKAKKEQAKKEEPARPEKPAE